MGDRLFDEKGKVMTRRRQAFRSRRPDLYEGEGFCAVPGCTAIVEGLRQLCERHEGWEPRRVVGSELEVQMEDPDGESDGRLR